MPAHNEIPKIAKTTKKKNANPKTSPNDFIEESNVLTRSFIEGIFLIDLRGRISQKVHMTDTLLILGDKAIRLVRTTIKSIQFQGSLRYVQFPKRSPNATIFIKHSNVNTDVKNGSLYFTILFLHLSALGSV